MSRSSAPAGGFFAAASVLRFADPIADADVRVDMLEMLPTPWGLVRSGVAPDHPKTSRLALSLTRQRGIRGSASSAT